MNTLHTNDNTITKKYTVELQPRLTIHSTKSNLFSYYNFCYWLYVCTCRKYCALNRSIYYLVHHVLVIDKVTLNNKRPPTRNVNIA